MIKPMEKGLLLEDKQSKVVYNEIINCPCINQTCFSVCEMDIRFANVLNSFM